MKNKVIIKDTLQLVTVQWADAVGADGWCTEKELLKQKPTVHNSVGYVIADTKEHLTITMSYDEDKESLGAWLLIPKTYIKKIKKL